MSLQTISTELGHSLMVLDFCKGFVIFFSLLIDSKKNLNELRIAELPSPTDLASTAWRMLRLGRMTLQIPTYTDRVHLFQRLLLFVRLRRLGLGYLGHEGASVE